MRPPSQVYSVLRRMHAQPLRAIALAALCVFAIALHAQRAPADHAPAAPQAEPGAASPTPATPAALPPLPAPWSAGLGAGSRSIGSATPNPFALPPAFVGPATPHGGFAGNFGAAGFSAAGPGATGLYPAGIATGGFAATRQGAALNPFSFTANGSRPPAAASLFPLSDGLLGPSALSPPSLSQVLRGSYSLPFSSANGLHFAYQDMFKPGASFTDLANPSSSAMFATSLGNGVSFSAGTNLSRHSMAGAPPASIGNAAGPKHSSSTLDLKLSF